MVSEVAEAIRSANRRQDRIGMLFVTRNGSSGERILGIITPWDVAGYL